ncbi:MAG: UDP-N-acetylmuramate--L-alanine ligase [Clostridiaceae bacterium]|nr:UDP-N-acetylmuramate--L-alanine ligase [Clostridiaceae bacterium]
MLLDFIKDKNKKIHFIGIGGISMSGLAEIMLENNFKVSGSDMKESEITSKLTRNGAKIFIGHKAENVIESDLIVYTAAISKENPELLEAQRLNIKTIDRAEFLGAIMKGHKYNVAIAGTHGKTTTTSMVSHITLKADLNPTILVGGKLDLIEGNVRAAKSDYFITEACEYKGSFLKFYPYIGVILNIDADHLDYYKDIDEIEEAFLQFAKLIPDNGYLICNAEDSRVQNIISKINCTVCTFGIEKGNIQAKNITYSNKGCPSFEVHYNGTLLGSIDLNVPGNHNLSNSLASIGVGLSLNISFETIRMGLFEFYGTHRRFENKGEKNGVTVIDEYAHHPTEIKAALKAAKNYPHNKIYCVFQPHTYSRTITLFKEFSEAFTDVDELILADIYAAREKDTGIVSSDMLGDKIRENGVSCVNFHDFKSILDYLKKKLSPGDLLLTVGAGDVNEIGEMYLI